MKVNQVITLERSDPVATWVTTRTVEAASDTCAQLPVEVCCNQPIRYFWAEDGRHLGQCSSCGKQFIDRTQLRDSLSPWIGVDLDGTLAMESSSARPDTIGAPVQAMLDRVLAWIADGKTVKIFTARAGNPRQVLKVQEWLRQHGLPPLEITNIKDYRMIQLWDDRCVCVATNQGQPVVGTHISTSVSRAAGSGKVRVKVKIVENKLADFFAIFRYLLAL
jgi:hypothetical protein